MWEQAIVIAIVLAAAGAMAYYCYKKFTAKSSCCGKSCRLQPGPDKNPDNRNKPCA